MKYLNDVKGVRLLGGYRVRVVFKDGYIGEVDLWPLFENTKSPLTELLKDMAFFQKVSVDPETHVVRWPNGYDICSDVLRHYCEQSRVMSKEELNSCFGEQISDVVLHDKPKP